MAIEIQLALVICGTILALYLVNKIGDAIDQRNNRKALKELLDRLEAERLEEEEKKRQEEEDEQYI